MEQNSAELKQLTIPITHFGRTVIDDNSFTARNVQLTCLKIQERLKHKVSVLNF